MTDHRPTTPSPTLARLQTEHPELCFVCGLAQPAPHPLPEHDCGSYNYHELPALLVLRDAIQLLDAKRSDVMALEQRVDRIDGTLKMLIYWLGRDLGDKAVTELLNNLGVSDAHP